MAEAIAALSLACNILQLIDSGVEATKIIQQTYRDGSSKDNDRVRQASNQLGGLSGELEKSIETNAGATLPSKVAVELKSIASLCQKNAKKLCQTLDKLQNTKSGMGAIWTGVKTSWKRSEIEKMVKEMRDNEQRLETCMLLYINESSKAHEAVQTQEFKQLNEKFQKLIQSLITQAEVSDIVENDGNMTRQAIFNSQHQIQEDLNIKFDSLTFKSLQSQIMQSLTYPQMNERISQIHEAEDQTFGWIYDETFRNDDSISQTNEADGKTLEISDENFESINDKKLRAKRGALSSQFRNWLVTGQGVYWINGKAGSGKSTFMKFLWQHQQTTKLLCQNVNHQTPPLVLRFSFWLSGSVMQRTLNGMLCSLLHQIFSGISQEDLSHMTVQHGSCLMTKKEPADWSLRELAQLLLSALQLHSATRSILICVDGLDELDFKVHRDPNALLEVIKSWCDIQNVKVCASSRPERFWLNSFSGNPQFCLQDLTEMDIRIYVLKKLNRMTFDGLLSANRHTDPKREFIDLIVRKAEGVFLWVFVVVHRVIQGLIQFAGWDELMMRVSNLPSDMATLYQSMLERAADDYDDYETVRKEVAMWLKICLLNATPGYHVDVSFSIGHCVMLQRLSIKTPLTKLRIDDIDSLQVAAKRLITRIPAVCAGLVEIAPYDSSWRYKPEYLRDLYDASNWHPIFLHRTVKDFLTDIEVGKNIIRHAEVNTFELLCSLVCSDMVTYAHLAEKDRAKFINEMFVQLSEFWGPRTPKYLEQIDDVDFAVICDYMSSKICALANHPVSTIETQAFATESLCAQQRCLFDLCRLSPRKSVWFDFMGLTLAHNCDSYFMERVGIYIRQPRPVNGKVISQEYLDYLLLCACTYLGDWSSRNISVRALNLLLAAGANPNKIFHLPVGHPKPRSIKSDILVRLINGSLPRGLEELDWNLFFDKVSFPGDIHSCYFESIDAMQPYMEFDFGDTFLKPFVSMAWELKVQALLKRLQSTYRASGYRGLILFSDSLAVVPAWSSYVNRVVLVPKITHVDGMSGSQPWQETLNRQIGILSDGDAVSLFEDVYRSFLSLKFSEHLTYIELKIRSILDDPSTTKACAKEFFEQNGYYYEYMQPGCNDSRVISAPIEIFEPQDIGSETGGGGGGGRGATLSQAVDG